MLILAWLISGAILTVTFRNRLWVVVGLIISIRLLIPQIAGSLLVGEWDNLHPASWWTFLSFAVLVIIRGPLLLQELRGSRGPYFAGAVLALVTVVLTAWQRTPVSLWGLLNTLIAALLFFLLVRCAIRQDQDSRGKLARWYVFIAVTQAGIGVLQVILNDALVYIPFRLGAYWFNANEIDRALGTADSTLDLSLLLLSALPLTAFVKNVFSKLSAIAILGAGMLLSQSRVGVIAFALVLLFVLMKGKVAAYIKIFGFLALVSLTPFLLRSELAEGALGRFNDDSGSVIVRQRALDYFMSNAEASIFVGRGFGSSFDSRTIGAITTSLESSYLMFFVDFGGILAAFFVSLIVALLVRARKVSADSALFLGAIAAVAFVASYSGFMTQGAASSVLWFILALASAPRESRQYLSFVGDETDPRSNRRPASHMH